MAIKIDVPGVGEVSVEGIAQESTMQDILSVLSKMSKTNTSSNLSPEEKKAREEKKKETKAITDSTTALDKFIKAAKDTTVAQAFMPKQLKSFGDNLVDIATETGKAFKDISATAVQLASSIVTTYDQMAQQPIQAAAGIMQTWIDVGTQIAKIGVDMMSAVGQATVGWIPFIGGGLAQIVNAFGTAANQIIDVANQVLTVVNGVLQQEFQKRVTMLNDLAAIGGSFSGGLGQMAQLANQSGVGIATFSAAIVASREELLKMGGSVGDATAQMAKGFAALSADGGQARGSLLALGYSFQQQGVVMAQYLAQQKALGININDLTSNQTELNQGTIDYAKNLKVITDITGQNAQQLMDQALADAQRGALENQLTAKQSQAFQQAYATLAAVPGQQAPKLQAALEQLLAGGTVTDPVIAGNQQVMTLLNKTAQQVMAGNQNMVVNTQANLAEAANAFRASGQSATDFATLMDPTGTSSVAQGMSALGNALNQYQAGAQAGADSMNAATAQAQATDGLTQTYVSLTNTMTSFQNKMEGIAGQALPAYAAALTYTTNATLTFMSNEINAFSQYMTGQMSLLQFLGSVLTGGTNSDSAIANKANAILPGLGNFLPSSSGVFSSKSSGTTQALAEAQESTETTASPTEPTTAVPSAADGGILSGSTAGFAATLHGTEAVVPLPDNRSIPVTLDSSSLTAAVNQQTGLLSQILSSMNKNNNLTSGILQASM